MVSCIMLYGTPPHSSKILMIQQAQPWGVSFVGNPRQVSTGFNSGSLIYQLSIYHKLRRGLTKC